MNKYSLSNATNHVFEDECSNFFVRNSIEFANWLHLSCSSHFGSFCRGFIFQYNFDDFLSFDCRSILFFISTLSEKDNGYLEITEFKIMTGAKFLKSAIFVFQFEAFFASDRILCLLCRYLSRLLCVLRNPFTSCLIAVLHRDESNQCRD